MSDQTRTLGTTAPVAPSPSIQPMTVPAALVDVVATAAAAGDFTTLSSALAAAGLVETLQGAGPFTLFAPTDAAFAKLPKGTLEGLLADTTKLARVLSAHVLPARRDSTSLRVQAGKEAKLRVKTVEGRELPLRFDGERLQVGEGRAATVTRADVAASNGIIHAIDGVLLPTA